MKELSIEEKAKRYDEAIYIAKNINNEHRAQPFDVMTRIFPELKDTESEDEKTRKELYEFCMKCSRGDTLINQHADFQRWATWLEKQGESKFEQCRQDGDKIVTNDDGTHFNVSQLERVAKKEPKKISSFCREHCKGYQETGRCFVDGECQAKKNAEAAWSEEDENMLKSIIATCELAEQDRDSSPARHLFEMQSNWLKSLKERIKSQWKPSEEQMQVLIWCLPLFYDPKSKETLKSLIDDLKKL